MLNTIFSSVFTETTAAFTFGQFLACTAVSLILGLLIAAVYRYKSECTKSFAVTLVLMPVIVQMVIMLVNRNLGTAAAFAIIVEAVWFILVQTNFGEKKRERKRTPHYHSGVP